jgi:hypothetical protein
MKKLQKFHFVHMPQLKVVPTEKVILHEHFDAKRTHALKRKIIASGVWKDPPIVTTLPDGRYMVLDGANRTTSMKALSMPHMLVQVVDYFDPSIELRSWNHVVKVPRDHLIKILQNGSRAVFKTVSDRKAKKMLAYKQILAYLCGRDGKCLAIPLQSTPRSAIDLLNIIVDSYEGESAIHRTEEATRKAFHGLTSQMNTLVVFPSLTKLGLLNAIARGQFLPSGISRHLILRRALRVYLPLSVLQSKRLSIKSKQARVDRMIADKFKQGQVRFYPEGIYLFDE